MYAQAHEVVSRDDKKLRVQKRLNFFIFVFNNIHFNNSQIIKMRSLNWYFSNKEQRMNHNNNTINQRINETMFSKTKWQF